MSDSFTDAGLDSIMLSELRTKVQDRLNINLDGTALMQNPSVSALAAHVTPLLSVSAPCATTVSSMPTAQCPGLVPRQSIPLSVQTVFVDEDVTIANGVKLGAFVTIGKGSVLHPNVRIASNVALGEGVDIGSDSSLGPFCVIGDFVKMGRNATVASHCNLDGKVILGNGNKLGPFCHFRGIGYVTDIGDNNVFSSRVTIGLEPENYNTRPQPTGGIRIGNDNCFRESVNVHGPEGHRGGELDGTTIIGNRCYIMSLSHIAHDNILEQLVTLATGVKLGGYTRVMYKANVGIGASVHQYSTIGPFCMVGMQSCLTCDAMPYTIVTNRGADGRATSNTLNVIGLTRSGRATTEEIAELEQFYNHKYNPRKPYLKEQVSSANVWYYDDFSRFDYHRKCQDKRRPVCPLAF
eukprot:TRINITY_DN13896_c0_g1_i1.p1 TRINITY_DN13896_c0_g1~~TRINITY_DN13896_c0_g1_i1.p1  ORF type:complete len:420 (-),score=8.45 TRINITY_DN13896_c0_g1_i1:69-1292(-)